MTGGHGDAGAGVTAGVAEIDVRDRGTVLAETGHGPHGALLIGKHGAMADGATHGGAQLPVHIDGRVRGAFQDLGTQSWEIIALDHLEEMGGIRLLCVVPVAC